MRIESLGLFNPLCESKLIITNRESIQRPVTGWNCKPCLSPPLTTGQCFSGEDGPPPDANVYIQTDLFQKLFDVGGYGPPYIVFPCDDIQTETVFHLNEYDPAGWAVTGSICVGPGWRFSCMSDVPPGGSAIYVSVWANFCNGCLAIGFFIEQQTAINFEYAENGQLSPYTQYAYHACANHVTVPVANSGSVSGPLPLGPVTSSVWWT